MAELNTRRWNAGWITVRFSFNPSYFGVQHICILPNALSLDKSKLYFSGEYE